MDYFCIVAAIRDEPDLPEWVEYHRLLGVERFYLYDNQSLAPVEKTLKEYVNNGLVKVWKTEGDRQQLAAFRTFIKEWGRQTKWAAFLDADEFLLPHTTSNICDFMQDYEYFPALGVHWQIFGSNAHLIRQPNILGHYTKRASSGFGPNKTIKTIAQPTMIERTAGNPHSFIFKNDMRSVNENKQILKSQGNNNPRKTAFRAPVTVKRIQLNHYFTRSFEDFRLKQLRKGGHKGLSRADSVFPEYNAYCNEVDDYRALNLFATLQAKQ